jgi:hypothetical protein
VSEGFGQGNNRSDHGLCIGRGIGSDKSGNRFELGQGPAATRLLAKPLAQSLLLVILREPPLLLLVLEAVAHFVEDVEVVLDIFKRAVFSCSQSHAE